MSQFRNMVARLCVHYDVYMHSIMGNMLQTPLYTYGLLSPAGKQKL